MDCCLTHSGMLSHRVDCCFRVDCCLTLRGMLSQTEWISVSHRVDYCLTQSELLSHRVECCPSVLALYINPCFVNA